MILVDTNVLVALVSRDDTHHSRCVEWLSSVPEAVQLGVLPTVIAEACYLISEGLGTHAETAFLSDIGVGEEYPYQLLDLTDTDLRRMSVLVSDYADLRIGATDASVVAVAERLGVERVATLDRRHFCVVRPAHIGAFTLLP